VVLGFFCGASPAGWLVLSQPVNLSPDIPSLADFFTITRFAGIFGPLAFCSESAVWTRDCAGFSVLP